MQEQDRLFKDRIYEQFARVGRAVASPKRLELLDLLSQGPRTVEALAQEANLSVANASQHLQVLRSAKLVEAEKAGLFVTYRLASDKVGDLLRLTRTLAEEHLAEVDQITRRFLAGREGLEPVDREALLQRVREGSVVVLDVRPVEEYRAGHIAGAISVPLEELENHLSQLPRDREIVAYCRGPYCVLAVEAVGILRASGFDAVRLEDGALEWKAQALPTVSEKD